MSSGYYNAHTTSEYINRNEIDAVINKVVEIVSDVAKKDFPKYEYIEVVHKFYNDRWYKSQNGFLSYNKYVYKVNSNATKKVEEEVTPKKLPEEYEELYEELVVEYGYDVEELEYLRESYGDRVIYDLYVDEAGPFYQETDDGATVTAIAEK